jgi:hypothetical protein
MNGKLLLTLQTANREQMLSIFYLKERGFTELEINAAAARGDVVIAGSGSFASVVLTVDGEQTLTGIPS